MSHIIGLEVADIISTAMVGTDVWPELVSLIKIASFPRLGKILILFANSHLTHYTNRQTS